jgi:alpha-ketoglutarate-dependent 2,4-dichlorophenoxyacetate dioxygenase
MPIEFKPLHSTFAAEVSGVDLSKPLSKASIAEIERGMDIHGVLVFRNQNISNEQQLTFSRNFGEIELALGGNVDDEGPRRLPAEFADVSNMDAKSDVLAEDSRRRMFNLGNRLWHSDSSFRATPAKYSLLSGRVIPVGGGDTQFADMRAAYDRLDSRAKAKVEPLVCRHSLIYSRNLLGFEDYTPEEAKSFASVRQRLVRTHPVTGRKSLFLSAHIGEIEGWSTPDARAFLRDLVEDATTPDTIFSHRWRRFDLVMWDNRQTMHRVRESAEGEIRDVRRTTVAGEGPTLSQAI